MELNRRSLIRNASLLAAGNFLGFKPFGMLNSLAQTTSSYKALVCVFLFGGNDANNTIIPFDTAGYTNYANLRGPLALQQNTLLPLTPTPNFALNPNLPELQGLFNSGNAAIVVNVGTLIQPVTRTTYLSGAGKNVPTNLFSHPDQQLEWQNAAQSTATQTGWAGRIADAINLQYNVNAQIPMIASVAGDTLFCNGASTSPASVSPGNLGNASCSEGATECVAQLVTAQQLVNFSTGLSLVQADNTITSNAYSYASALTAATRSVPAFKTVFPANNGLASQLKQEFAGPGTSGVYSGTRKTPTWYKNFGPHIGIAYSVDPKTVVRAGFVLTYAHGNNIGGAANVGPSLLGLTPSASAPSGLSSALAFYWDQNNAAGASYCTNGVYTGSGGVAWGWTGSIVAPAAAVATTAGGNGSLATYGMGNTALTSGPYAKASSSSPAYYDPYLAGRAPEYENWNIGIQREITKDMSVLVSYVGSQGHFVSVAGTVGSRNGLLPESLAAMGGGGSLRRSGLRDARARRWAQFTPSLIIRWVSSSGPSSGAKRT